RAAMRSCRTSSDRPILHQPIETPRPLITLEGFLLHQPKVLIHSRGLETGEQRLQALGPEEAVGQMGGDQAVELLHADRATRGDDHSAVETNLRPGPATGRQKPRSWRQLRRLAWQQERHTRTATNSSLDFHPSAKFIYKAVKRRRRIDQDR